MESSRSILHFFLVILLIGYIYCQDNTSQTPTEPGAEAEADAGADAGAAAPVASFTTTTTGGAVAEADAGGDGAAATTPKPPSEDGDSTCNTVSSEVDLCNTNLDKEEATCEKLKEYDTCVENALEECTDEATIVQVRDSAEAKKGTKAVDCTSKPESDNSTETSSDTPNAVSSSQPDSDSMDESVATTTADITEPKEKVVSLSSTTEGTTVISTQKSAEKVDPPQEPAEDDQSKETTESPPTTVPTTTEIPVPPCEDPIAKAGEVQKCNDEIEQDSLCIQIQKAVDCVEVKADCSEEKFDREVDNYLASFENYALDYGCIITFKGKRLEQRRRPGQAAQSQAQSGSSFVTINLFSSFAVICAGLLFSH